VGPVELPLDYLQLGARRKYQIHDLVSDARHLSRGQGNRAELDPQAVSAHMICMLRGVRTEQDCQYCL